MPNPPSGSRPKPLLTPGVPTAHAKEVARGEEGVLSKGSVRVDTGFSFDLPPSLMRDLVQGRVPDPTEMGQGLLTPEASAGVTLRTTVPLQGGRDRWRLHLNASAQGGVRGHLPPQLLEAAGIAADGLEVEELLDRMRMVPGAIAAEAAAATWLAGWTAIGYALGPNTAGMSPQERVEAFSALPEAQQREAMDYATDRVAIRAAAGIEGHTNELTNTTRALLPAAEAILARATALLERAGNVTARLVSNSHLRVGAGVSQEWRHGDLTWSAGANLSLIAAAKLPGAALEATSEADPLAGIDNSLFVVEGQLRMAVSGLDELLAVVRKLKDDLPPVLDEADQAAAMLGEEVRNAPEGERVEASKRALEAMDARLEPLRADLESLRTDLERAHSNLDVRFAGHGDVRVRRADGYGVSVDDLRLRLSYTPGHQWGFESTLWATDLLTYVPGTTEVYRPTLEGDFAKVGEQRNDLGIHLFPWRAGLDVAASPNRLSPHRFALSAGLSTSAPLDHGGLPLGLHVLASQRLFDRVSLTLGGMDRNLLSTEPTHELVGMGGVSVHLGERQGDVAPFDVTLQASAPFRLSGGDVALEGIGANLGLRWNLE